MTLTSKGPIPSEGKPQSSSMQKVLIITLMGLFILSNFFIGISKYNENWVFFDAKALASLGIVASRSKGIEASAEVFYSNLYKSINASILANKNEESNLLSWGPRGGRFDEHFVAEHPADFKFVDLFGSPLKSEGINITEERAAVWNNTTPSIVYEDDICKSVRSFFHFGGMKPHVVIAKPTWDGGALSSHIPGRTSPLPDYWKSPKNGACSMDDLVEYFEHPNMLAVITNHQQCVDHPKVHALPLGVRRREEVLKYLKQPWSANRTQLLMVNHQDFDHRLNITKSALKKFASFGVKNTYRMGTEDDYFEELKRSKFVLSPSGHGYDCYRTWEALYMGTIPVVDTLNRTDGWYRVFDDLPVLLVNNLEHDVTPELLEESYDKIVGRSATYNYEKLTRMYWFDFMKSFLKAPEL